MSAPSVEMERMDLRGMATLGVAGGAAGAELVSEGVFQAAEPIALGMGVQLFTEAVAASSRQDWLTHRRAGWLGPLVIGALQVAGETGYTLGLHHPVEFLGASLRVALAAASARITHRQSVQPS